MSPRDFEIAQFSSPHADTITMLPLNVWNAGAPPTPKESVDSTTLHLSTLMKQHERGNRETYEPRRDGYRR